MRPAYRVIGVVGLLTMVACSASPGARTAATPASTRPAATATPTHSTPPPPPVPQATVSRYHAGDGSLVTVAEFSGPVTYRLHCGSFDPGPRALSVVHAGPRVTGAERRQLLAAFQGGFQLSNGVGGYEQEGHVISPVKPGFATLVIDQSGKAHLGVWGAGLPQPGEAVYSVRQNLQPLVKDGHATPLVPDWRAWGPTLGGGEFVARGALGQDAAGNLMYAGSMSTSPAALAAALVHAGAVNAMELDINPEWVQLDVAATPGGPLKAQLPGQVRPADQYLLGWTRDFITVLG